MGLATLQRIVTDRRQRERHFPGLSDPAFAMLTDLALQHTQGRKVSVTSACLASYAPATTALRHISMLVGEGLIERVADPDDARRIWLELTERGALKIGDLIGDRLARAA